MTAPQHVRALISSAALASNARRLRGVADLRRDAWGHGLIGCAPVVHAAGLEIADDREPAGDVVDPAALWGLPGAQATPVMTLIGSVLSTKTLRAGEGVSYGYTFRAATDTRIALVCGGYAQGVVREVGNGVRVRIGDALLPIVGRVAMDACVVDIGAHTVGRGDDVVYFGDPAAGDPALRDWTAATGLQAAEIVSLVGARARRVAA